MKRKRSRFDSDYKESQLSRLWWNHGEWFIAGVGIAMVVVGCWIIYFVAEHEARAWQQFSAEQHCRVVGKMAGDMVVGTGLTANGQVTTTVGFTGDKTGYICDDGVTYWR